MSSHSDYDPAKNWKMRQLQLRRASLSRLFLPHLYCACAQAAVSQFPIKILASPLNSAAPIS